MTTKFLSDPQLEGMATRLLLRYDSLYGAVSSPPVPVERILEDVLDLSILWDDISEPPHQSILAALEPGSKTVVFNESRRMLLTDTPGLYYTVLGVCPRIRSWRRKPPRNNLLTVIWTLSWSN